MKKVAKTKKKWAFPTAYTVLLIVLLLVMILTYLMPSGKYASLAFNEEEKNFTIVEPNGKTKTEPGTQATLEKYHIKIDLSRFEDGSVYKPVAIPDTYKPLKKENTGIMGAVTSFLDAPIKGLAESIDVITFVLILGGLVGVINKTGAFAAGMAALSSKLKGKEAWLIVIVTSLVSLGGTTFGMAEETIAFYPILVPVFMAAGYDALVAIAAIYLGSSIGTMGSTVNPFSVVIASNTAGINFTDGINLRFILLILGTAMCIFYTIRYAEKVKKDPTKSLIYSQKAELEKEFLYQQEGTDAPKFDFRKKLMLIVFAMGFVVMVYSVKELGWFFTEISMLFLFITFVLAFISGLSEKDFANEFVAGAADLLGTGLTIALARGVTIIMEDAQISDTLLYWLSNSVSHMSGVLFTTVMFFVFILLGFFIPSSSGLAVLSMPIMAPLADVVGIPRDTIVTAYNWGQGIIAFITPTGLVLASLAMVNITFDKWVKFVTPLMVAIGVLAILLLGISVYI
ncbi:MAG: YfcC family protein [Lactobacillales bacterium]|nr:YfcC family protein [Lactobacillales bacterium]